MYNILVFLNYFSHDWGRRDLNSHDCYKSTDFKSVASTIPPRPHAFYYIIGTGKILVLKRNFRL